MRITLTLAFVAILSGCGGYQERAVGLEEETRLVIRGESLVGLNVSVDSAFTMVVSEDDLTDYKMGILGVANSEAEDLESLTLKVDSGKRRIKVFGAGTTYVDKTMQFTDGQSRELRIRK